MQSVKQSLRHPVTWNAQHREPLFLGMRMPLPIHILCSCKICYICYLLILAAVPTIFDSGDPVAVAVNTAVAVVTILVYAGCMVGAQKKHFFILVISTGFLLLLTLARIGSTMALAIIMNGLSDREILKMLNERDNEDDKIYTKTDVENIRKFTWTYCSIISCCLLCYNGPIIGLCAYYAKHIKKGKVLNPAPVLP